MEITVKVPPGVDRIRVVGNAERNLKMLREALGVHVAAREGRVQVSGERAQVMAARRVLEALNTMAEREEEPPTRERVLDMIGEEVQAGSAGYEEEGTEWDGRLNVYAGGKPVRAQTPNQQKYLEAIRAHDLVFALGPAGTGKTYLAVAAAVHLLKIGRVKRVILARPAVEAGEKLGYLPGDLRAKVNPYLRPLFDALADMMDFATLRRFMESDVVEVSPLAFMRGRTLNNAVIILDEAQNTTKGQMKMFLTRLGHGSKMVVTGDATQVDIPDPDESGLIDAAQRLRKTAGVGLVSFTKMDVVRHNLVQKIIEAYGGDDASHTAQGSELSPETQSTFPSPRGPRRARAPRAEGASRVSDNPESAPPERSMEGAG